MSNSGMTEAQDRRGRFSSQKIINYVNQKEILYKKLIETLLILKKVERIKDLQDKYLSYNNCNLEMNFLQSITL